MLRSFLSLVALGTLMTAQPYAQGAPAPAKAGALPDKPTVVVNVNTATATDFEQLPGIGPKAAARIIEYRQKKGPFKKIEEIMNVQGIGEKTFLKLKPQLTIGSNAAPTQHD